MLWVWWLQALNVTCFVVIYMAVLSVYIHTVHGHCQVFCLHLHNLIHVLYMYSITYNIIQYISGVDLVFLCFQMRVLLQLQNYMYLHGYQHHVSCLGLLKWKNMYTYWTSLCTSKLTRSMIRSSHLWLSCWTLLTYYQIALEWSPTACSGTRPHYPTCASVNRPSVRVLYMYLTQECL